MGSGSFSQGRETNCLLNISPVNQSHRLCRQAEPTAKSFSARFPSQKGRRAADDNTRKNTWARRAQSIQVEPAKGNMYVREHVSVQVCEHRAGWEQGKDKDREEQGFCMGRQLCSEPFTKVMCHTPHSSSLAQPHHFYPCLIWSELGNPTALPRNLLSALHWS